MVDTFGRTALVSEVYGGNANERKSLGKLVENTEIQELVDVCNQCKRKLYPSSKIIILCQRCANRGHDGGYFATSNHDQQAIHSARILNVIYTLPHYK